MGIFLKNSCSTSALKRLEKACEGVQFLVKLQDVGFSQIELFHRYFSRIFNTDSA